MSFYFVPASKGARSIPKLVQRMMKQTKNMFDFHYFLRADCAQSHRALRQKTTKSLNLAEKTEGNV
jgi:hypothetical protein